MHDQPTKACSKCGVDYPATPEFFFREKKKADGLHAWCKGCKTARTMAWFERNPDRVQATERGRVRDRAKQREYKQRNASPERFSWVGMLTRVRNPNATGYERYGGRGITICARWDTAQGGSFENFLADMGERPAGTTLDRIDNDGNYEPANCRWATPVEQRANRRPAAMKEDRVTDAQRDVLLALNIKQMQRADTWEEGDSIWTAEVARVCGRSNRSTATVLSQVRDFGWVYSTHGETVGWVLTAKGVAALERDAGRVPSC